MKVSACIKNIDLEDEYGYDVQSFEKFERKPKTRSKSKSKKWKEEDLDRGWN